MHMSMPWNPCCAHRGSRDPYLFIWKTLIHISANQSDAWKVLSAESSWNWPNGRQPLVRLSSVTEHLGPFCEQRLP